MISKATRNNLLLTLAPFLVAELVVAYPVFHGGHPLLELLAPISLLTLAPIWGLQDALQAGSCGGLLALLLLDMIFISIMYFSVTRNHKIVSGICVCTFIFLSVGFVAAGY